MKATFRRNRAAPVWSWLRLLAAAGALALSGPAFAGPDPGAARAEQLLNQERFQPPAGWRWGSFRNADGATLRYGGCHSKTPARGVVVILPSFQSPAEEFFETARDFQARGFDVWMLDWRGQGGSDRWLADRQKTYSKGLERDERDLVQFVTAVIPRSPGPLFFVGQSFGGHVGLRVLHDHPGLATAAAFSSPSIGFQTGGTPSWLVRTLAGAAVTLGFGADYALDQHDWSFDPNAGGPKDAVSDDRERALATEAWLLENPGLQQGGATWSYVDAFYRSSDLETEPGWMKAIRTPVLIGEVPDDKIANAPMMTAACHAMRHCTLMTFSGTKHAILGDRDAVRAPYVAAVTTFFLAHGARSEPE
jgi:lysophospholipase